MYDSAQPGPVGGAIVAVRNLQQTSLLAVGTSDTNGEVDFNLNADSLTVIATAPGYLFNPFDTVVVSGPGSDTLLGYRFNPAAPGTPGLCRVFGFLFNLQGTAEKNASVTAYLPKGVVRSGSSVVSPFAVVTSTDSTGYWQLDLIASPQLNPSNTLYEITVTRLDGTVLRKRVLVPDQSTWEFTW